MQKFTVATLMLAVAVAAGTGLPSLADTIRITDWLLAGPFAVGTREGIAGPLEDPATFRLVEGQESRTSLVQGGVCRAHRVMPDSAGWLATDYQDVRWDTIANYYGIAGIVSMGIAYAEFAAPKRCRALAVATRLGGFTLNGLGYLGDVYGNNWFVAPVVLDSGTNRLLLRLSGFGDTRVRFLLVPPRAAVLPIAADLTAPDLQSDSALTAWVGVPLLNTTDQRLDSVRLRIVFGPTTVETIVNNLPALGARKVKLQLSFPAQHRETSHTELPLVLTAIALGDTATDTARLPIRLPSEPVRQTFISSIDSSVQYYACLYPKGFDPGRRYPVIFTLHGAGVEAWGQASAYQQKDWAFVVAPTNRRPYGFDWQDWGRLDAIEVLDTVLHRLPIDPARVLLTGGSMGGHGDWHLSVHHPDRFAVVAPQASWPTHQLYVPWFLQRSAIFAQPGQLAIRDQVLRSDNVPALLGNLSNLPCFVLHGGDDDNVPPLHGRNFALWLDELGQECVYRELPGKGHWWADESLGITVCDDTALLNFIRPRHRSEDVRHVSFRAPDLGTSHKAYWCEIERVGIVGQDAAIEATADDSVIRIRTENIERFSLNLFGTPKFAGQIAVFINGFRIGRRFTLPNRLTFSRTRFGWQLGPGRVGRLTKTPDRYGPARQAMMQPFLLVYGTANPEITNYLRHTANQEALRWWLIGNGSVEVLADTEVTNAHIDRHNLLLFGGPTENSLTKRINSRLPVRIANGRVRLGSRDLGPDLAVACLYPNPQNPERLVYLRMGTGPEETRLSSYFGPASSSAGIPDFLVFDRRVRRYGWAGIRAAGFFDPDWQLDERSMFVE